MATSIISGMVTAAINLTPTYYLDPVTNTGTVTLATAGVAVGAASNWSILNAGLITTPDGSAAYGLSLATGGSVNNADGATISSGLAVKIAGSTGAITNSGLLLGGTTEGVLLTAGGFVSNADTGTISGITHAVLIKNAVGTVVNEGTLSDVTKAAVALLDGGTVTNGSTGIIRVANTAIYVTGAVGGVVNYGYLYASTGHAIDLESGGVATNALHGTLTGQHPAFYSSSTAGTGAVTLINAGLVEESSTTASALALQAAGGSVTNEMTGVISGANAGIVFRNGYGYVLNDGLVTADLHGVVVLDDGGRVSNQSAGRILGTSTQASAVYVTDNSGIVINHGLIQDPSGSGVALFSGGTVEEYGSGVITGENGVFIKGGAGTVQTVGTIIGTGGQAVGLPAGYANRVDYVGGAVFEGVVNGGNVIGSSIQSTLRLSYYTAHPVGTLTNLNSTFVNFQQISVKASWVFTANDSLLPNVTLTDSGAGTDSPAGTIEGYALNLGAFDAVTVEQGAMVTRTGTPATHTAGIYAGNSANDVTIANYGVISDPTNSNSVGIALFAGGTVTNTGTVIGTNLGIYGGQYGPTTITNSGLLQGNTDNGVEIKGLGAIINLRGGTLSGPQSGFLADSSGSLVNDGLVTATGPSTYANGVYLRAGGSVTNQANGVISASDGIVAGTIFAPMTVVDAGTIEGTSEAIQFQTGAGNILLIEPGAYIRGVVNGANAAGSGLTTTVEFASGQGSFNIDAAPLENIGQVIVESGGYWAVGGNATVSSGTTIHDLGRLMLTGQLGGLGDMELGSNATLAFSPLDAPGMTIGAFAGHETIEVLGVLASGVSLHGNQLTISGTGVTLNVNTVLPSNDFGFLTSNGNTYITACFAAGTSILTAAGPRAVETLQEGDMVITATGRLACARWIGHRRTDLGRHRSPHDVMPVRVHANAFGPSLPLRDLVLSPDHAVFVDDHLVPIRHLINGVSIVQETRQSVTYWHVELDRHDIIVAEGLACESFLDTGNRHAFEGAAAMQLHPAFGRDHALAVWQAQGCAPILVDPAAPALRAIHTRLLAQARNLPIATSANVSG